MVSGVVVCSVYSTWLSRQSLYARPNKPLTHSLTHSLTATHPAWSMSPLQTWSTGLDNYE